MDSVHALLIRTEGNSKLAQKWIITDEAVLYHTRIRIWYDHTRMVRITVPSAYGAYETTSV